MDCQVIEKVSSAPAAPPFTGLPTTSYDQKEKVLNKDGSPVRGYSLVTTCTRNMWDRLFHEGYRADVRISTDDGGDICAHADVLVSSLSTLTNYVLFLFLFIQCFPCYSTGDISSSICQQGMASPVLRNILRHTKGRGRQRSISIHGVPHKAVQVFIRFLYSSWYIMSSSNPAR
uniref:Uncharacterized protein n=1 Tax=Nelumbo nucifera TaxID=4432 RepID=A0A822ZIH5_NELNU|nr:TPA_asm: hypothetical protein HUJ06_015811 [Nelumbo nucifera]